MKWTGRETLLLLDVQATPGKWFAGAMNDCVFIVDRQPSPSPSDVVIAGDLETRFIAKLPDGSKQSIADANLICIAVNKAREELHAVDQPIDMLLFCPSCFAQHVDAPDERTAGWTNPPHKSHLCHNCGHVWRPSDHPTNGVAEIQTKGGNDGSAVPHIGRGRNGWAK
jgi:hypothetical protein